MKNGYTIDCMLKRYSGVNWNNKRNWNINNNKHPTRKKRVPKNFHGIEGKILGLKISKEVFIQPVKRFALCT
jgi:hypothetical protein